MIGSKIGHYGVLEKIGEGGMGVVYRAHDEQLDREVAIKLLPPGSFRDEAARARLLREARSAAALNHPNICTVHEVGEDAGQAYIAMELIQGQSLSDKLAAGRLPGHDVLNYGVQLADALAHAHAKGLIHRDLKSANVIVSAEGHIKVLDFGLAKRIIGDAPGQATASGATLTSPGTVVGTLAYMAPEQLRGQPADERSDIWALGAVLHEMSSGARPFKGATGFELSSAILNDPPGPLPADVRPELKAVIGHCLEKEPSRRYQRASEVRAALDALRSGGVPVAFPARPIPWRLWLAAACGALFVVLVVLVGFNIGGLRERLLGSAAPRIERLAVLPLENLSRDAEQDYFAEGTQEELITDLARLGAFKVVARESTMRFRHSDKPLKQIASELHVDALLTGAVMHSGDQVRITAHLINGKTEDSLWDNKYERQYRDILAVQNEIVSAIAHEVNLRLSARQQAQLSRAKPVNPEAHEAYLKGMFYIAKATPEGIQKGLAYMQQAIEKDPGNAMTHAMLALAYDDIGHNPGAPPDTLLKARASALKALELDPDLGEAHAALAMVKMYSDRDWDWAGVEKAFQKAIQFNPSLPDAHAHYGWYLLLFKKREEALAQEKLAFELSPLAPIYPTWVAEHLMGLWYPYENARDFQSGMEYLQKALEVEPDFPVALHDLGRAYAKKQMYKQSIEALRKVNQKAPDWGWPLGITYAKMGRAEDARKVARELTKDPGNAWSIAEIYAVLGDKDDAFRWLEEGYRTRHVWLPWIRVDTSFDSLRDDPRFVDLLARMKLTP